MDSIPPEPGVSPDVLATPRITRYVYDSLEKKPTTVTSEPSLQADTSGVSPGTGSSPSDISPVAPASSRITRYVYDSLGKRQTTVIFEPTPLADEPLILPRSEDAES